MDAVLSNIIKHKIVPVVKLDKAEHAIPVGKALCDGGLPIAEITFRTEAGEEAIRILREKMPDMIIGAGTIVNVAQAKRAAEAGAEFIVSPGLNKEIIKYSMEKNIPVFPGACTPTEIMMALECGLEIIKFFPAKQFGGIDTMKALSAPFPSLRFMPTGGIDASNICDFLKFKKIIACGGSWMVKDVLINEGKFDEITRLTREAAALVKKQEG